MRAGIAAAIVLVVTAALASPAGAAPGDLDTTFGGGDGIVVNDETPFFNAEGLDVVVQPDGRMVVAGATQRGFLVVRFTTDGALDPTFSGDGWVEVRFPRADWARATSVDLDSGGRILAGGRSGNGIGVVRLWPGGRVDRTFGAAGRATVPEAGLARLNDLTVDGSDRVVFVGWRFKGTFEPNGSEMIVGRLTADGEPDESFRGGVVAADPPGNSSLASVALLPDGRIVGAGEHYPRQGQPHSVALRLWPGGARDRSFGDDGIASLDLAPGYESATAVGVDPDGRVSLAGWARGGDRLLVARLTPDGVRDTTFSGDGVVVQDLGRGGESAYDLQVLDDGRVVVTGTMRIRYDQRAVVLRYTPSGELDSGFGGDGWTPVNPTPGFDNGLAVDLAPTGEVVTAMTADFDMIGLARLEGD